MTTLSDPRMTDDARQMYAALAEKIGQGVYAQLSHAQIAEIADLPFDRVSPALFHLVWSGLATRGPRSETGRVYMLHPVYAEDEVPELDDVPALLDFATAWDAASTAYSFQHPPTEYYDRNDLASDPVARRGIAAAAQSMGDTEALETLKALART